ncbi:hypothetical protein GCM10023321_32310 [Pseudonocardia eucalypti]|uniref:GTP-eEF1A C-terminal domain-containing protein n=1 Tax=Pseudonocardia eucalypti TaxID=648755 RepID=A0ABP9Q5L2_9PSEU
MSIRTADPLPADDYADSRATGSFLLIDPPTGNTLAAGLVGRPLALSHQCASCAPATPGPRASARSASP